MWFQNGRSSHSGLARRVGLLEGVLAPVRERDAQDAVLERVWQSWPRVLRCFFAGEKVRVRPDDVRTPMHVEQMVGLAVRNTSLACDVSLVPIAAVILREAVEVETWRLIFAHGGRAWSYGCPERQEAAQTLLGVDAADLHTLDDDGLVRAWIPRAESTDQLPDNVRGNDVLNPAALRVLEAATDFPAGGRFHAGMNRCPHAGGHDQVPRHVRDELTRVFTLSEQVTVDA